MKAFTLHEDPISANCYKIRLTASLLGIHLERRSYSVLKGETRTSEFLQHVSPNGKIPVLQIDATTFLPEGNAICYYLAETSDKGLMQSLIPAEPLLKAEMLGWMFFEQNQHETSIATLRFWLTYVGESNLSDDRKAQVKPKQEAARAVLEHMDNHLRLSQSGWFVSSGVSLADVCLYAYTHVAHEARFDLENYPAIKRWCLRMESVSGYTKM